MNCKEIQEVLLTDYVDGMLEKDRQREVEDHLVRCATCREFAVSVQKAVSQPFTAAPRPKAPEALWENIKAAIAEENESETVGQTLADFWERFKDLLAVPRPVYALASLTIIVFTAVVLARFIPGRTAGDLARTQPVQQVEYLASILEYADANNDDANGGYGTDIEEMLL